MRTSIRPAAALAACLLVLPVLAQEPAAQPAAAQTDPKVRAAAIVDQARPLAAAQDWKQVRALMEEALALDPGNAQSQALLGLALHGQRRWGEALLALEKAAQLGIEPAVVARTAAECADRRKDRTRQAKWWLAVAREEREPQAALRSARAAEAPAAKAEAYELAAQLGRVPKEDLVTFARAESGAGAPQKGAALFDQAAAAFPDDVKLAIEATRARLSLGDLDAAEQRLRKLSSAHGQEPGVVLLSAELADAEGDKEGERKILEELVAVSPKFEPGQLRLGDLLAAQGDFAGASARFSAALAADPNSAQAHDALGRLLYAQGKRQEALPHLEAAVAPGTPKGKKRAPAELEASGEALVALADLQLAAGKRDVSRALVARAKAAGAVRLPVIQARLLARDGDLAGAERTLSPYLATHPGDGDALSAGADIAYDRARFQVARDRFEKAVMKTAITPAALGRLCDLRVRGGAYEPGKESCKAALAGGNDAPAVHASLGLALYQTGDKAGAKRELSIAGAADKKNEDVATHAALGAIALEESDEKTALSEYELVLKQKKDHLEANTATGRLLLKKGNQKEAAARLARAFAARSDDALLGADLAKAQLGAGNLSGAQRTLSQIRADELLPEVQHGLKGRVENGLGNYRKAHEEYEKALRAKPGDADLLALDGENYLKLPNYEKAIALLEQAAKADPSRLDVASELTRLYAETGQAQKAATALLQVEALQKKQVEDERKSLDPKLLKRLAIGDVFKNGGSAENVPQGLDIGLRGSVADDLSRSPRILIIDTRHREDVAKERDRLAQQRDVSPEELEKLAAKEQAPQGVLSGIYVLGAETFQLSVEVHDLGHTLLASATEEGSRKDYAAIEKKVALKILDRLVPLTAEERAQLQRLEGVGTPSLDSFALAAAAQDAQARGDARAATDLYQRARANDQSNARALVGLEQSLLEVEKKNQIAIPTPQTLGPIEEVEKEMFRRTLTDKLSGLKGLRIVEQKGVKEVLEELDRIMDRDRDNIDPQSVDLQKIGKKLAANVLVRSTMQREGDHLSFSASLIDISDQKLLKGAAVDGLLANRQKLQADLARQIVQQLRGEPTDEEKAALEATMKEEEYQRQMAELTRLLEKEKRDKLNPAKAAVAMVEPPKAQPATAPAQPAEKAVEFTDAMIAPELEYGPDPEYTRSAIEREVEGMMVVRCVVSVKGEISACRVMRSLPFMDSAVVSALERRRYHPALLQGKPIAVNYTFKIRLTLPKVR